MPAAKPPFPAARVTDAISVSQSMIVSGEETVLIGSKAKPVACKDCKARQLAGRPVNTSYGSKILPGETDFALPAAMPFAWQRFYASDTPFTGLLGQGWRTSVEIYCDVDAARTRLVDIQGRWIDFAPLEPGEEETCPSESLRLARGTADQAIAWDGRWQWLPAFYRCDPNLLIATPGDGDYMVFAPAVKPAAAKDQANPIADGRYDLIAIVTRHGYSTRLHWRNVANATGQTVRVPEFVTDSAGRIYRMHCTVLLEEHKRLWNSGHPDTDSGVRMAGVSLAYDPLRDSSAPGSLEILRTMRVTEWLVHYAYSQAGDLIEVQDGDGDWMRRFEYKQHLMTRHQTPGTSSDGTAIDVRYEYDGYDVEGKVLRQIQAGGMTLDFAYHPMETVVTDSLRRATRYQFEGEAGLKRLVKLIHPDGSGVEMAYTRDAQLARRTDQLGRQTHFKHNNAGDFLGSADPLGNHQQSFRDAETGLLSTARNAEGHSARYKRDARGNVTEIIAPDGSKTCYQYEDAKFSDRPSAIVDARGGKKTLAYNSLGQLSCFTDCSGKSTRYQRNRKGLLDAIESADGKRQVFKRDAKDRIVSTTFADGTEEKVQYDRAGRLTKAVYVDGQAAEMHYDRDGRLLEHRISNSNQGWSITRYQYDVAGRLIKLTNPAGAAMGLGYDVMDRLTHEVGFDGKQSTYRYNAAGEVTAQVEAANTPEAIEIRLVHDAGSRLIARHIPAFNGSPEQVHRFTYNKLNQLTSATTYNSQVEFAYNPLGQLIAETQSSADGHSQTLRFAYDILGNRTQLVLPDGQAIDTLMYGSGHWHQIAFNGHPLVDVERDNLHREISRTYGSGTRQMVAHPLQRVQTYTAVGQLASAQFQRADRLIEQRQYQYDTGGLLTRVDEELDGLRSIVRYGYDAQQRLSAWDRHDVLEVAAGSDTPGVRQTHAQHYAHDAAGNPVAAEALVRAASAAGSTYTTPEQWAEQVKNNGGTPQFNLLGQNDIRANRLAQYDDVTCSHDERGNVVKRQTEEGSWDFAWNALNQMTVSRFTAAGTTEPAYATTYFYDAFGRRIGKLLLDVRNVRHDAQGDVTDGVVQQLTRFVWDGDRMVQERHANHVKTIVYEPGSFVPLAQIVQAKPEERSLTESEREELRNEQHNLTLLLADPAVSSDAKHAVRAQLGSHADTSDTQIHLFMIDHLGTPYRMLDARTHATVWAREQDPWGTTTKETVSAPLPESCIPNLRFQGQQWDWETRLCYNRYRYYDPKTHAYLTQDPIGLRAGLNTYTYPSNPIQNIDSLGLFGERVNPPGTPNPVWNGLGDTSACSYYDEMDKKATKCSYYKKAAMTCRGENFLINNVMEKALLSESAHQKKALQQAEVLTSIRTKLVKYDQEAQAQGKVDANGCTRGNEIDAYHEKAFTESGISPVFYGGNNWIQNVWPNYVPLDPSTSKWDPRRIWN